MPSLFSSHHNNYIACSLSWEELLLQAALACLCPRVTEYKAYSPALAFLASHLAWFLYGFLLHWSKMVKRLRFLVIWYGFVFTFLLSVLIWCVNVGKWGFVFVIYWGWVWLFRLVTVVFYCFAVVKIGVLSSFGFLLFLFI